MVRALNLIPKPKHFLGLKNIVDVILIAVTFVRNFLKLGIL